jgi:hypothetical protein
MDACMLDATSNEEQELPSSLFLSKQNTKKCAEIPRS